MAENPNDDWKARFIEEAKDVARLPDDRQEEWLAGVKKALEKHPNREESIQQLRSYMDVARRADEARAKYVYVEEKLEADALSKIEGLMDGSMELPQDTQERLRAIAYFAILGHLLPNIRERLGRQDAQNYLAELLKEVRGSVKGGTKGRNEQQQKPPSTA